MPFFTQTAKTPEERAFLVGVKLPGSSLAKEAENLDELKQLAETAGADVIGRLIQQKTRIDGSTYIGKGKLEEISALIAGNGANLVIFDDDLSPAQARNIEAALKINVIDRTELILDIFSRRARTRQARIQVEIAQLKYALPRLRRLWDHLSRQAGGIGTRGPGETQLEVDRRKVREKISHLGKELKRIDRGAAERRKKRKREFNVTIVGYTNAGKSTLLNRIAGSGVVESGSLFSTLDSTTRRVSAGGETFLLTDTVGFIRKLPAHLVASFRATLLDVEEADLLLHLVDSTSESYEERIEIVEKVLEKVLGGEGGAGRPPIQARSILVFNKCDMPAVGLEAGRIRKRFPEAVMISAASGDGVDGLLELIGRRIDSTGIEVEMTVSAGEGKIIAAIEESARIIDRRVEGNDMIFRARISKRDLGRIERGERLKIRPV